jgi:hypothetical protein
MFKRIRSGLAICAPLSLLALQFDSHAAQAAIQSAEAWKSDAPRASEAEALQTDTLTTSAAADTRPVTQDQFKELLRIYKRQVDRFDKLEKKVNSKSGAKPSADSSDGAIDLENLSSAGIGEAPVQTGGGSHGRSGVSTPGFKVYFDLNLIARPGIENFSFDTYHSFLFFELQPTPDIQFSFDVNPSPRYYELDYQVTKKLQLRAGKIWIPFDDMSPHNIFGGRVNVSRLQAQSNAPAFLPDLWTDLGLGFRYALVDTSKFALNVYGYVVNGFREGGVDPKTNGSPYPKFSDLPSAADNNRDKAVGGRVHMLVAGKLGLGLSYYTGRWSNDTGTSAVFDAQRLSILGIDGQIRIKSTEFRVGVATMALDLPTNEVANRGGAYVELGQKFGKTNDWKALARAGLTQLDDRVLDNNPLVALGDEQIVGGTLLWKPGLIQYSIEYNRDLGYAPSKKNYSYTAARIVMAF